MAAVRGVERTDASRHLGAPVATLRAVARVAQVLISRGNARAMRQRPSRGCGSAPENP